MNITDNAKLYLQEVLKEKGKKAFRFEASGHCCHLRLVMHSTDEICGEDIGGLYVDMNEETKEALDGITIDLINGRLAFVNTGNCGCDDDCHSGCGGCHE